MQRIGVMFMQSQEFFGADSQVHASIMRHLGRDRFDVHCAVPIDGTDGPVASAQALRRIPDVRLRATQFPPTLEGSDQSTRRRRLLRRGVPSAWSLLRLAVYVRWNRIKLVHCTEKPRDAVVGSIIARLGGARCVIHVHVKAKDWLSDGVQRAMSNADALIGVSEFVARSIRDLVGDGPPVHAVLNGLELEEWAMPASSPADVRRSLGISTDALVIISASRLFRYKGQHELLAALPEVKKRFPDVRVLIVGADDPRTVPGEGNYSEVLERMCDELGLNDTVLFTGWRSDVRELMAASDLYVMPSFEEPFGMVFIEAMYLGKPVVALDNGGTREVVEHGTTGLLSDPGDTDALARHVIELLADGERREQMGRAGRERVERVLNARRMAVDAAAVYESVLNR